jgi:uncharacterized protein (DUF924 family)
VPAPQAKEVLEYWKSIGPQGWWRRSDEVDAEIVRRFGELHRRAAAGELDEWRSNADDCLALVILLDQFSRNMFRGDPRAFAADGLARAIADGAIQAGFDKIVDPDLASFFYMPFMHSEALADQERCIELFRAWAETLDGEARKRVENSVDFARRHRDIVQRFGRFPHRNALLGRASTPEELAFLEQPGSSF